MHATAKSFIEKPLPACVQLSGGTRYMPIRLKVVLADYGIAQTEWGNTIVQTGGRSKGRGISQPTGTQLLNWGIWPKTTPTDVIKSQTEKFLRLQDVPEEVIKTIWEELGEDDVYAPPRRGHTNTPQVVKSPRHQLEEDNLPETEMLSAAAKKHFKIFKDPFVDDVQDPDDVFLDADQRYIREAMHQTAKHGGFIAVIGESGAGKTTLRRDLLDRIAREGSDVTVIQPRIIDKGRLTAGAICDAIICDVSQEALARSLEGKARQIERLLTGSSRSGNAHVLIIEEAHDLTVQTLKYLKRFWELEDGFRKLMAIILIGQPELKNKLDERQNWEAREVIRRCEVAELRPLNGNLEEYLALKFKRIGKTIDELFDKDAFDAIRERLTLRRRGADIGISMLYPLVVNNTVTKALNLTAEIGAPKISAEIIKEV